MVPGTDVYQLVKLAHLVAVVVGFGALVFVPVILRRVAAAGAGGPAVVASWLSTARAAEWALYAAGLLGVVLVLVSSDVWKFSQAWVSLGFVVYFAAVGVFHAMLLPALRRLGRMVDGTRDGSPNADEVATAERKVAVAGGVFDLTMLVGVAVMVWKPGL